MSLQKKLFFTVLMLAFIVLPVLNFALIANAAIDVGLNEVNTGLGGSLNSTDPRTTAGRIINIALGFLGVIAVILIVYAGFKWMTAAGNEEAVDSAKKLLTAAIIGLIIIFMAWGIATFVLSRLVNI